MCFFMQSELRSPDIVMNNNNSFCSEYLNVSILTYKSELRVGLRRALAITLPSADIATNGY